VIESGCWPKAAFLEPFLQNNPIRPTLHFRIHKGLINSFLRIKLSQTKTLCFSVHHRAPRHCSFAPTSTVTHHKTKHILLRLQQPQSLCIISFRGIPHWKPASDTTVPEHNIPSTKARFCKTAPCNRFVPNFQVLHAPRENTNHARLIRFYEIKPNHWNFR